MLSFRSVRSKEGLDGDKGTRPHARTCLSEEAVGSLFCSRRAECGQRVRIPGVCSDTGERVRSMSEPSQGCRSWLTVHGQRPTGSF